MSKRGNGRSGEPPSGLRFFKKTDEQASRPWIFYLLAFAVVTAAAILIGAAIWAFSDERQPKEQPMVPALRKAPVQPTPAKPEKAHADPVLPANSRPATPDAISEILSDPSENFGIMVKRLLLALPYMDEKSQEEAAHHIANLSTETTVADWSGLLAENRLPQAASGPLYDCLLNFPTEVSFPVLARIADFPTHPKCQQTLEIFEILMDKPPPGVKWVDWVKAKSQEKQP